MEEQHSYGGFAQVYDIFMDDLDYDLWAEEVDHLIRKYGIRCPSHGNQSPGDIDRCG